MYCLQNSFILWLKIRLICEIFKAVTYTAVWWSQNFKRWRITFLCISPDTVNTFLNLLNKSECRKTLQFCSPLQSAGHNKRYKPWVYSLSYMTHKNFKTTLTKTLGMKITLTSLIRWLNPCFLFQTFKAQSQWTSYLKWHSSWFSLVPQAK